MHPELRSLIDDFRDSQDRAIDFLHGYLRIPIPLNGVDWVRTGHTFVLGVQKSADDRSVGLYPHGCGIDVTHPDFRIDFDYGPSGQIDCFDVWRLALHRHRLLRAPDPVGPYDDLMTWIGNALDAHELLVVPDSHGAIYQDPRRLRSPESLEITG